jgi:hypothetical protein
MLSPMGKGIEAGTLAAYRHAPTDTTACRGSTLARAGVAANSLGTEALVWADERLSYGRTRGSRVGGREALVWADERLSYGRTRGSVLA